MTDRPIPFSDPMARAIDAGRKTMTRRVLRPGQEPQHSTVCKACGAGPRESGECEMPGCGPHEDYWTDAKPPYAVGDRLWVRESPRLYRVSPFR